MVCIYVRFSKNGSWYFTCFLKIMAKVIGIDLGTSNSVFAADVSGSNRFKLKKRDNEITSKV